MLHYIQRAVNYSVHITYFLRRLRIQPRPAAAPAAIATTAAGPVSSNGRSKGMGMTEATGGSL